LREDLDHRSDHFPIETSFLFSPPLSPHVPKPLWKKANKAVLSLKATELDLLPRNYENCKEIDAGVDRLVRWIKEAVAQHIPLSKPASFSVSWWSSELTQLVRNARRAWRWHTRRPCAEAWKVYREALCAKREAIKKAKAAHFKQAVADTARGRRGIWPLAKWAKQEATFLPPPHQSPILLPPQETPRPPLKKQKL
jgi:hypothetical protein